LAPAPLRTSSRETSRPHGSRLGAAIRLALGVVVSVALAGCFFRGKSGGGGGEVSIEYAPIAVAWVKKHVPATPSEVKTWAATPEGKAAAGSEIRHVLVSIAEPKGPRDVAAAKKRAQALIARLTKGEDPKAIAREASDDDDTRDKGGALGTDADKLAEPLKTVAKQLGPGDLAGDPIKGPRGFHIVLRDTVDEALVTKAYKKARATIVARKLADEILARLQSADATVSIETVLRDSVAAVLGEAAANDPKRHKADSVPRDGAASADLPPDARDSLAVFANKAKPGEIVDSALGTGPVLVVARAVVQKP
jgi:hypothetical protein